MVSPVANGDPSGQNSRQPVGRAFRSPGSRRRNPGGSRPTGERGDHRLASTRRRMPPRRTSIQAGRSFRAAWASTPRGTWWAGRSSRRENGRNRATMDLGAGDKQPPARTAHDRCGERNAPLRLETPVCRSPDGRGQDPAPTPARMFIPSPEPALLLAYHPIPVPGAGHHRLGKSLPISLVALDPLFPGSGGLVAGPVHGGILRAPGVGPEPIPRWDVQFGGLEDYRKDSTSPHITHRILAGKPLAGFRATPDRRIIVLCGMIVSVIRFNNPLLHRQSSLRKRRLGENRGFRPSF